MSLLILHLSLCVLTVIQMTSSAIMSDVTQPSAADVSNELITPAYGVDESPMPPGELEKVRDQVAANRWTLAHGVITVI